ncbi:MAG: hypothetical protein K1X83_07080 [Oligoflexia bacterium]|nr:hypothetical protein [Oligoflexia bacterium]
MRDLFRKLNLVLQTTGTLLSGAEIPALHAATLPGIKNAATANARSAESAQSTGYDGLARQLMQSIGLSSGANHSYSPALTKLLGGEIAYVDDLHVAVALESWDASNPLVKRLVAGRIHAYLKEENLSRLGRKIDQVLSLDQQVMQRVERMWKFSSYTVINQAGRYVEQAHLTSSCELACADAEIGDYHIQFRPDPGGRMEISIHKTGWEWPHQRKIPSPQSWSEENLRRLAINEMRQLYSGPDRDKVLYQDEREFLSNLRTNLDDAAWRTRVRNVGSSLRSTEDIDLKSVARLFGS